MYEKSYGSKYRETQGASYMGAADIAKLMRADIKEAKTKGKLPKNLEVSVTVENYSGGRSIEMKARYQEKLWVACSGLVVGTEHLLENGASVGRACHWYGHGEGREHEVLSIEGQRIKKVLEEIHWAYNYDGSDIMTDYSDVNYYGSASVEDAESAQWREREKARKAKLRDEADERKELIAWLAKRTLYKAGRMRQWKTESMRELKAKIEARDAERAAVS